MKRKLALIDSLTSLRFFAALGVFLHHLGVLNNSSVPAFKVIGGYFFNGYTGVTFFYILSGFIINYSFCKHRLSGKFDYKDFLAFRISRLFPVHILSLALFILAFSSFGDFNWNKIPSLISNLFLIQSFIPFQDYYFAYNPVSWSISCELFFYFAFCFLVRFKTSRLLFILFIVISLNLFLINYPPVSISSHWLFYINPFFRMSDFIIGVVFCRAYLSSGYTPSKRVSSILEVLAILSFFITVFIATNFIKDMNIKFDILFIPCMLMLVVVFAFNNGVISGWLSNKYLILLGESSFSFYMIHFIIVNKLYEIMSPSPNNFAELAGYISTALLCSVVSSVVIFKLFEMPINRFIRNKWISVRYK